MVVVGGEGFDWLRVGGLGWVGGGGRGSGVGEGEGEGMRGDECVWAVWGGRMTIMAVAMGL